MMKHQGKFIVMSLEEFEQWLSSKIVIRKIALIQQHHTFIPNYRHFNSSRDSVHFKLLESMERSHKERGFAEIGQNFTTFPDGTIGVCRDINIAPAGIKGANQFGICIEHIGNFDTKGDTMTQEQRETIIKMNALLCQKFKLTPNSKTIVYHHWYDLNTAKRTNGTGTTKSCPGSNFFGGNTVEAAEKNFIPLIKEAI